MKLHELKQKRNTIATDMRALNEKIGDTHGRKSSALSGTKQNPNWKRLMNELHAKKNCVVRIRRTLKAMRKSSVRILIRKTIHNRMRNELRFLISGCVTVPVS